MLAIATQRKSGLPLVSFRRDPFAGEGYHACGAVYAVSITLGAVSASVVAVQPMLLLPLRAEYRRPEKVHLQVFDLVLVESGAIAEESRVGRPKFRITGRQVVELGDGIA